jgi:hypothetical protein
MRARIVGGQVRCGRPGCTADPFGPLRMVGMAGDREVWIVELSLRWLWHIELEPRRWRRAPRPQRTDEGQPDRELNEQLPTVVECSKCRAVQRVALG